MDRAVVAGLSLAMGCGKGRPEGAETEAAKVYKLTYSIFFPPMHIQAKTGMD
jgi:hypothetical protein